MNDASRIFCGAGAIPGLFPALGLIIGGWVLGAEIKAVSASLRWGGTGARFQDQNCVRSLPYLLRQAGVRLDFRENRGNGL